MSKIQARPAIAGADIPDPIGRKLPDLPEGFEVDLADPHWARMLALGEIVEVKPEAPAPKASKKPQTED